LKILKRDIKHGIISLLPESLDDLWVLYNIIQKKDVVYAKTTRSVKLEEVGMRPTKGKRIPVFLGVQVNNVEYQRRTNRLRFTGIVISSPEDLNIKGSHHTISIIPGNALTIEKEKWDMHELRRIKRSTEKKAKPIIVVGLDNEEYCVALLGNRGFDIKHEMRIRLPGKIDIENRAAALSKYFRKASENLISTWNENRGPIAIVGPGFLKEAFLKYLREKSPDITRYIEVVGTASNGGISGIKEALRSGILEKVAKKIRMMEETKAVEKVLYRLGSPRRDVAYGCDEVEKTVNYGAVEMLLISDELFREIETGGRVRLEDMIRKAEKTRSKIMFIEGSHEAGKKLMGLGGVAALLRYPVT
jgi:protein pelota